jgi:hypothetical protein
MDDYLLEEQQSVWQYLKVFSIYQENSLLMSCENPVPCGNLSPDDMFNMINDTLKGGRYTRYDPPPPQPTPPDEDECELYLFFDHDIPRIQIMRPRDPAPSDYIVSITPSTAEGDTAIKEYHIMPSDYIVSITPSTVYVSISEFTNEAWELFRKEARYMADFDNIVIDLRYNSGGLLNAVENMLGVLLKPKTEFIQYRYRDYDSETRSSKTVNWEGKRTPDQAPWLLGKNIAVLINGGSASASEIMASALKDCAGAHLIGDRSYGKGIGQLVIPRTNRKVLRITHMEIRGLTDRTGNYHRKGINSDPVPEEYSTEMDIAASAWAIAIKNRGESLCPNYQISSETLRAYFRNFYCAIKTVEPNYTPPLPPTPEPPQTLKAAETGLPIEAALSERAMQRLLNRGKTPIGVYVVSEPDPLK